MSRKDKEGGEGVGYGRPPKHSRFKKGQSGNPKGRPRKTKPSFKDMLRRELESEKDFPKRNGGVMRITQVEAYAKAFADAALRQPLKAYDIIMHAIGDDIHDDEHEGLSDAQEAILKRALGPKPKDEGEPP